MPFARTWPALLIDVPAISRTAPPPAAPGPAALLSPEPPFVPRQPPRTKLGDAAGFAAIPAEPPELSRPRAPLPPRPPKLPPAPPPAPALPPLSPPPLVGVPHSAPLAVP